MAFAKPENLVQVDIEEVTENTRLSLLPRELRDLLREKCCIPIYSISDTEDVMIELVADYPQHPAIEKVSDWKPSGYAGHFGNKVNSDITLVDNPCGDLYGCYIYHSKKHNFYFQLGTGWYLYLEISELPEGKYPELKPLGEYSSDHIDAYSLPDDVITKLLEKEVIRVQLSLRVGSYISCLTKVIIYICYITDVYLLFILSIAPLERYRIFEQL